MSRTTRVNSSWFADIAGYDDIHPAKGKPKGSKMSGLKVVDDNTFKITLNTGIPYYAFKLGYASSPRCPSGFFKDPKGYGEKPVGNGPYKFASLGPQEVHQGHALRRLPGPGQGRRTAA